MRSLLRAAVFLVPFLLPATAPAAERPGPSALVRELLSLPAPPPDWRAYAEDWNAAQPPGERIRADGVPEEGAPLDVLLAYYRNPPFRPFGPGPAPSPRVRERLLEAALASPSRLAFLLRYLPDDPSAHTRLLKRLGDPQDLLTAKENWRRRAGEWLLRRCGELGPELAAKAREAHDENGAVAGEEDLEALSRGDWELARPVLHAHAAGDQPRTRAVALALLYRHAVAEPAGAEAARHREALRAIAEERAAPGYARWTGILALMHSEWEGRDDWYLSLFADPTLRELREGHTVYHPLGRVVREEPDRWIPVVAKLVGNEDRATHETAVRCLSQFEGRNARADALRLLLPWLEDREWATEGHSAERLWVAGSLDEVDLPESVPSVLRYLESSHDASERRAAARALARYRAPQAIPVLRRALNTRDDAYPDLLDALDACGGLSDREAADAIIRSARPSSDDVFRGWSRPPSGDVLRRPERATERRAELLAAFCRDHAPADNAAADAVAGVLASWPVASAEELTVDRLRAGELDAKEIAALLRRGERLGGHAREELAAILPLERPEAGIAAVLLGTDATIRPLLARPPGPALAGLLAAARLVRRRLPVDAIAPLLGHPDADVAAAAEAYLVSDDGPDAREAVWALRADAPPILGRKGGYSYEFDRDEQSLRRRVAAPDGPDEIYALLAASTWGTRWSIRIEIDDGAATLQCEGDGDPVERALPPEEITALREWLSSRRVERLPPLETGACDGVQYDWLHLMKRRGFRVYMNNPGIESPWDVPWLRLVERFRAFR